MRCRNSLIEEIDQSSGAAAQIGPFDPEPLGLAFDPLKHRTVLRRHYYS
jgi:hypothetical protein